MSLPRVAIAAFVIASLLASVWLASRQGSSCETQGDLERLVEQQRQIIGQAQRLLLDRLQEEEGVGKDISAFPELAILVDEVMTPDTDYWDYYTRTYDGPRGADLKMYIFGLDERPPEEHLPTFFKVYVKECEITDIEVVSPLY